MDTLKTTKTKEYYLDKILFYYELAKFIYSLF